MLMMVDGKQVDGCQVSRLLLPPDSAPGQPKESHPSPLAISITTHQVFSEEHMQS